MKQGRWAIASVCVILGMMLVFQFRVTRQNSSENITLQRAGNLSVKIQELERERDALKEELSQIKQDGAYEGLLKENKALKIDAGIEPMEGSGIIVTIADSSVPVKSGENPNLYLIHDEDILKVINELKSAGAEAISINEQRVVANTEVRCVGPTITVNRKSFAPPFTIKAIGNPNSLAGALTIRGGVADSLKYWGIELKIEKQNVVEVPAYNGSFLYEYAKAVGRAG